MEGLIGLATSPFSTEVKWLRNYWEISATSNFFFFSWGVNFDVVVFDLPEIACTHLGT